MNSAKLLALFCLGLSTLWGVQAQTDIQHKLYDQAGHYIALPMFFDDGTMHFRYMPHEELAASFPKTSPAVAWDYEANHAIGPFMSPWRAQYKWFNSEKKWRYMYAYNTLVSQ